MSRLLQQQYEDILRENQRLLATIAKLEAGLVKETTMIEFTLPDGMVLAVNPSLIREAFKGEKGTYICFEAYDQEDILVTDSYDSALKKIREANKGPKDE